MSVHGARAEGVAGAAETVPRESLMRRLFGGSRSGALFTLIALVGGVHALLLVGLEANRFVYTESEIARLEGEIAAFTQESGELRAVIRHRNDLPFREQLARKHGFVHPDELRVLTRPQRGNDSASATLSAETNP